MERENKNPDRELYLQQLRDLNRRLEQRVQQVETEVQQVRDEVKERESEVKERERVAAEAAQVRAARRALLEKIKKRKNEALNKNQ